MNMNQFRQAWQAHALSITAKGFAKNYPLLNSCIIMVLAGLLWGFTLVLTFFPVLLLPSTLLRFPSPILGGIGAAIGSIPLWFATRDWLRVRFRDWMIAIGLGLAGGLGVGSWLFQPYYPPVPADNFEIWTGWQQYLLYLWAAVGFAVGVAIWIITRRQISYSVWIILALTLAGALLGGWLGVSADNTMISYGQTTNGQGERLQAVAIDVLLSLSILGTVVGIVLSALRIQQNLMQPRAVKAPPTYHPA